MKKVFTILFMLIIVVSGFSQTSYYVNDPVVSDVAINNVFTTAPGNNANPGTAAAPFATLTYALSQALAGDIIYVDAGTYVTPDITINKAIAILGANYLVSPNDLTDALQPNTGRNAESKISNCTITIGAANIIIKGLSFDPTSKTQIKQIINTNDFDNITVSKNIFHITSGSTVIDMSGKQVNPLVTFIYAVTDNRFIKEVSSGGTSVNLRGVDGIQILNNTFTVSSDIANRTEFDINLTSFRSDNVVISQNIAYRQNNLFQGISALNARIDFNKAIECNRLGVASNNLSDPCIIDISDNIVTDPKSQNPSIVYNRSNGSNLTSPNIARIERNTVTVNGTGTTFTPAALINATLDNTTQNCQVYIRDNKLRFSGDFSLQSDPSAFIAGIRFLNNSRQAVVERNEIEFNATNYNANNKCGIYIAHYNLQPGTNFDILNNKVSGYPTSLAIQLNDPFSAGAGAFGQLPGGVTVNINNNSFIGDIMSINNGTISQEVQATCNWYGSNDVEVLATKLSTETGQYLPWLVNGTDNELLTTGFQPVPGSCTGRITKWYVNDNSLSGDVFTTAVGNDINDGALKSIPFATMTAALANPLLQAGDTIYVDAGTYALASSLTINKAVTVLGSNYTISPNNSINKYQYNSGRIFETRFTGSSIIIGADNVNIKGLRFSATTSAITSNANYSHIKLEKNYFDVLSTGSIVSFQGTSTNPIVASDFSITDNRFERTDLNVGNSINLGAVKSVFIDNNVFIESPASGNPFRGFAVRTVFGQMVESTVFSNNYVKKLQVGVLPVMIQDWTINNNVFDSCSTGYNQTPANAVSNNIFIRTNTFINARVGRSILVRGGVNGGVNNLNIIDNTINQEVDGINGIVGMIQLDFAAANNFGTVSVSGNKLNLGGNYANAGVPTNCGIILIGKHNNTTVSGNELTFSAINAGNNGLGVLPPVPTGIYINTDNGAGSGPIPSNAIINITNNKVNGFKNSIGFYDPTATGLTPTVGYGYLTNGAYVNINNNSFTNDSMSIDNGTQSQAVNASCNWYGSAADQNFKDKLSLETGTYIPWLTSGTDNDPATGFQPVPGSCDGYPPMIVLNAYTDVTCNGANNGTINITASYGRAPFTFTWTKDGDAGFISNDEDPKNLSPGNYHLAVVDANGSTIFIDANDNIGNIKVTITEPPLLTASAVGSNVSCFGGSNGAASITAGGGTGPYSYLWSNGAITQSINNLIAGTYSVTLTDAHGCKATASYEVTQPALLTAVANGSNVSCFGESNGSASVTAGGGTGLYSYLWSNGATTAAISNLATGTYNVTVTDNNGCTVQGSYEVTQPELLAAVANGTDVSCFNGSNGSASVLAGGGTQPYSYLWSNGATTSTINNLSAGTYNVTVTDNHGCTAQDSYEVTQPVLLTASAAGSNVSCFNGTNGSASVLAGGGTALYTYLWSNGATTDAITNLTAGAYSVTVTDANGCTAVAAYQVTQPTLLTANITGSSSSCANTATVTAAGGTGSYTYLWSNGSTASSITSVPSGTYSVTVTDANECTAFTNVTLTANEAFNPSAQVTDVTCYSLSNGTITVTNVNATPPYQYSIDGLNFQSSNVFNTLPAGTYTVTVKDVNGCTGFVTKTITQPPLLTVVLNNVQSTCFGLSTGSISVTASGGSGAISYSWAGPNGFSSTQRNINNLATGNYSLTVTDNNGCTSNLNMVVPSFIVITVNSVITNIACKGQVNGSINLTVSGGTGSGFTFNWSNNATTEDIVNLGVGNYSVIITDIGSGCVVTRSFTITQPANTVGLTVTKTNATGCSTLGTITATGSGGTSPYQYKVDNGNYQSSGSFANLYGGNYTVWVKDANGCTTSKTASITDNGSDQYESNNSKNQAALISTGVIIGARIALSADVADWFKFTTSAAGKYTLSLSHPSVNYTFNLYAAGNNTPALVPVSTAPGSKTYTLAGATTYYVSVTGGLSFNCYQLQVFATALPISSARTTSSQTVTYSENPVKVETQKLQANVYPNPHHGIFNLQINSPENGWANIELFNGNGQKIISKRIAVKKGENTVNFINIKESLLLYKVSIGKQFVIGKVIGPN